jgi:hypothetical protein
LPNRNPSDKELATADSWLGWLFCLVAAIRCLAQWVQALWFIAIKRVVQATSSL